MFNFGGAGGGNNPATTTTATGGFTFGGGGSTTPAAGGFGAATASTAPTASTPATGGFTFGGGAMNPATTASTNISFPFGSTAPPANTAPTTGTTLFGKAAAPTGGFSFGTPTTTTAASTGGFTFGQTTNQAPSLGGGLNLTVSSATTTAAPAGGLSFGGTQLGGQAPALGAAPVQSGGFTMGAPPSQTSATTASSLTALLSAPTTTANSLGALLTTKTTAAATSAPTATTGFALGGFAAGIQPLTSAVSTTQAPASGFNLSSQAAQQSGGFAAGIQPLTSAVSTTQAPVSGFNLGSQTAQQSGGFTTGIQPASSAVSTTQAAVPGFTLGSQTAQQSVGSTATNLFSSKVPASTITLSQPQQTTTSAPPGFSLTTPSSLQATVPAATTTATTSVSTALDPAKQMNYRQLEDSINKWMVELDEQEKIFLQQATEVNAWDRLLIENGEKITQLNNDMERVKVDQQRLDHELDFIKSQQKELEDLLVPLEKKIEQLPAISYQQHADLEREHTYQIAENIDAQTKRMAQNLKEVIDHLNTGSSTQDSSDPIQQITKILNAHMDSLQWIDQNTVLLNRKVEDISKQMDLQRKEQERNFRLVYD